MRKNGADAEAFKTICISGKQTSMPHGTPRNVPIEKGFITMDFGASYKGYKSDMTRTVAVGKISEDEIKKIKDGKEITPPAENNKAVNDTSLQGETEDGEDDDEDDE